MTTLLDQANQLSGVLASALQYIANVKVLLAACQSGPAICDALTALVPAHTADLAAIKADMGSLPKMVANIEFLRRLQADGATLNSAIADATALQPQPQSFMGAALPAGATLRRASVGWAFGSTGVLTSYAVDAPRWRYDPATLALQGLLVEPAATNGIRNASAVGAVAGTPGTNPTNWGGLAATNSGLTKSIVGVGVEDGIAYVDVRWQGASTQQGGVAPQPEGNTLPVAANGQTWTASSYLRLVAGSLGGFLSHGLTVVWRNGAGSNIGTVNGPPYTPTGAALKTQRNDFTLISTDPATASVSVQINSRFASNADIDVTLRYGLPQLVLAAAATSPIVTTAAAVTRAADVLTLTTPSGTYDVTITRASGATLLAAQVVGAMFIVPTDPSPLQSISMVWPPV